MVRIQHQDISNHHVDLQKSRLRHVSLDDDPRYLLHCILLQCKYKLHSNDLWNIGWWIIQNKAICIIQHSTHATDPWDKYIWFIAIPKQTQISVTASQSILYIHKYLREQNPPFMTITHVLKRYIMQTGRWHEFMVEVYFTRQYASC